MVHKLLIDKCEDTAYLLQLKRYILDYIVDKNVFHFKDGFVAIPNGPGLGIEVDETHVIKMAAIGHNWKNPIWRHPDNSIAEW